MLQRMVILNLVPRLKVGFKQYWVRLIINQIGAAWLKKEKIFSYEFDNGVIHVRKIIFYKIIFIFNEN